MPDGIFSESEKRGLHQIAMHTMRCTIPILASHKDRLTVLGCACAYRHEGRIFLVTAAHVAKQFDGNDIHVADGPRTGQARPIGGTRITYCDDAVLDVAAVELLEPVLAGLIRKQWFTATSQDTTSATTKLRWFFVAGYPQAAERSIEFGVDVPYHSFILSRSSSRTERRLRKGKELVLAHRNKLYTVLGKGTTPPRLPGISGGPVWALTLREPTDLVPARDQIRICGVQVAVKHNSYILATKAGVVAALLDQAVMG